MLTFDRKLSKKLIALAEKLELTIVPVYYKSQGLARYKGFDLQKNGKVVYSFEPVSYTNYKWFIRHGKMMKPHYKDMTEICNELNNN